MKQTKQVELQKKKNSEYWSKIYMMVSGCEIIDPDGWDRKNYDYSWYQEEITWDEFQKRAMKSTQWTLPLKQRYEVIFDFLSQAKKEAVNAERLHLAKTMRGFSPAELRAWCDSVESLQKEQDKNAK